MSARQRICLAVHGHFYQPPREDPVTGEIPPEPGAEPFANWNQRITAECYRPNAEQGNLAAISFDFGPTLLAWLEAAAPDVYGSILEADAGSRRRFGAGNALAQPYHHTILPLATLAEKELQVAWGMADFQHRFGRRPRGLWLPETAADGETLEVLAAAGITFTILAPWQARGEVDTTRPHWIELPSGRRLAAFFYAGELSGRLSFDPDATVDADLFARDMLLPAARRLGEARGGPRLVTLATDGELYGHHQELRELFLARLVGGAAREAGFEVTTPARHLVRRAPRGAVVLAEPTSWSCHHGVARWAGDCPCTRDNAWKAPFRRALERLAAAVDRAYQEHSAPLVGDPRELLRRYVEVVLGRTSVAELAAELAGRALAAPELAVLEGLLAAQWQRHRMFASCAWFHGELDRIEPVNALAAAAVAVSRVAAVTGESPALAVLAELEGVASRRTGRRAVDLFRMQLERAGDAAAPPLARAQP